MTIVSAPASTLAALREWFDIAPDATIAVDRDGRIVLANHRAECMFGYEQPGLCGLPVEALLPETLRVAHAMHRDLYSTDPHMRPMGIGHELTGLVRDGREFPVEISLSPVMVADDIITIASVRDISQTSRVRQALQRARHDAFIAQISQLVLESPDYESAVRQTPALVAEALEVPAAAILATDWHRDTFRIRAATGLTETTADSLTSIFGSGELTHRAFAAEDRAPITSGTPASEVSAAIRAGLSKTRYHHFALVSLFGRYEPLGVLIALSTANDAFDRDKVVFLQSVAGVLTATVQRSRAEEQLAHAQRLDAVGQLTGGIAHDFNNLLTVVSGNLQLLEADLSDRQHLREIIDAALHAVDRGAELTRKLLAFGRRQSLKPQAIKLGPLLADLERMLRRTLGEAIAVQIDDARDLPAVFVDPGELETALVNLALNARDAMPRGGRLAIAARQVVINSDGNEWNLAPGAYAAIKVADTGEGMAPDVRARACEPFFTTKGGGKGSGLGLSMVYGFATQSGGRMAIDSRLGYGTQVEIFLPIAAIATETARNLDRAAVAHAHKCSIVLVVEDQTEVRDVAVAFLRGMGYEVLAAAGASEALQLLATHPKVDLLFSDVVLGGTVNGVELATAARRTRPKLAVLLTSGYPHAAAGQSGTDAPAAFPLLQKPYVREQLADAVRTVLEAPAPGPSVNRVR